MAGSKNRNTHGDNIKSPSNWAYPLSKRLNPPWSSHKKYPFNPKYTHSMSIPVEDWKKALNSFFTSAHIG
jgi:hypothetical protein